MASDVPDASVPLTQRLETEYKLGMMPMCPLVRPYVSLRTAIAQSNKWLCRSATPVALKVESSDTVMWPTSGRLHLKQIGRSLVAIEPRSRRCVMALVPQATFGDVSPELSLADFTGHWLDDVTSGEPSTVELGRRFAQKIVSQWLDIGDASLDVVYCDGSGDGGIDIAVLDQGDVENETDEARGHTWYLIQSKYGKAFQGAGTLMTEGQKVIDSLDGKRARLSSLAEGLLERITNFRAQASEHDRIVLVFATEGALSEAEHRALQDVRSVGRSRLGSLFDVEAICIETIFRRLQEQSTTDALSITMMAKLVSSGEGLLVGSLSLIDLYNFLKVYRDRTDDLDRIYEKNVRRFLGGRGKVNKGIQATLRESPEKFGLYNNGITLVVSDYRLDDEVTVLCDPYIVNGCQTTKTVWEFMQQRLDAGGTGENPELQAWKERAHRGVVVLKVVKAGAETLLQAITRYTNSQNAVREKDFLAITGDFRLWKEQLAQQRDLYLEIQRGGWDSQKAFQKQHPEAPQFTRSANAADLMKIYGAGWLAEPGYAFGKNAPFLPNGSIFRKIMAQGVADDGEPFGSDDLYAAYLLQQAASDHGFGRGAPKIARRQTRFLFCTVAINLLKDVLMRTAGSASNNATSNAVIRLHHSENPAAREALYYYAGEVIDEYLTQGTENSVFQEPVFMNSFNNNLNSFLKWERLGKGEEDCPRFRTLLAVTRTAMGKPPSGGEPDARSIIASAIR